MEAPYRDRNPEGKLHFMPLSWTGKHLGASDYCVTERIPEIDPDKAHQGLFLKHGMHTTFARIHDGT